MRRIFAGVGVFIAAAGSLYLSSRLGPTTAPAPTSTVTQPTTAPPVSGSKVATAPPASAAPIAPPVPVSAPAPTPAQPALQSALEGELQSAPVGIDTRSGNPSSSALAASPKGPAGAKVGTWRSPEREPVTADSKGQPSGDEASPASLPYTTQKYLHDPFTETPASRSRAAASISAVPASDATSGAASAATSDPNDYTACAPSDGSPAPDDAGKANIKRANEWATAASAKAASLGLGAGRYDALRCRGDVVAEWLAAGGPEPLGWLGRRGFDSPLATCAYQIVVNRPAAAAQYPLLVTLNGAESPATLTSCDGDACVFTVTARCELQRQPLTAKWVGPSTITCLHGDTKTTSDGACEVQP